MTGWNHRRWREQRSSSQVFWGTCGGFACGASLAGGLRNRALPASGEPATATILNIKPPGERVNDCSLRMSFTLEVRSLSETFQATPEKYVPMHNLTKYQIGMKVNVKYDPTNKTVAAVDMAPPY